MSETSSTTHASPSQKPILKPSSFDSDLSLLSNLKLGHHHSVQPTFLESTKSTNLAPLSRVSFHRALSTKVQDPFVIGRKRAISTNVKLNKSLFDNTSNFEEITNNSLDTPQLNLSFQPGEKNDSSISHIDHSPFLFSLLEEPENGGTHSRGRSQTFGVKIQRQNPDFLNNKRKSVVPTQTKEQSQNGKIRLKPIVEENPQKGSRPKKAIKLSKQDSDLLKVCGSTDIFKKDRIIRFLEKSISYIFKIIENQKAIKNKDKKTRSESVPKETQSNFQAEKEGKKENKEDARSYLDWSSHHLKLTLKDFSKLKRSNQFGKKENKEEKRTDFIEFAFYSEIHSMIEKICIKEDAIYLYLKAIKLLGSLYLHYFKLDEAFCCFCQLRWASEYLGKYKTKASAFFKMAECCRLDEKYDEAIKLLRKSLQYAWEYNLINQEMKIYDALGTVYYLKGEIRKAKYYNERFTNGISEPKDSPLRDIYSQFLKDNGEKGRYGNFTSLTQTFRDRISLPLFPLDSATLNKIIGSSGDKNILEIENINKVPDNVKPYQEQLLIIISDSELILQKKRNVDNDDSDEKQQEGPEMIELPSPSFKANLAEVDSGKTNEQRLRELKLKEERLYAVIRNAKKELADITEEDERKKSLHNIFELQIAFQREKRIILGEQQAYRIHIAKLWRSQYHVFESKKKPGVCRLNLKTESNNVMENKYDMTLEDPDFFQGVKKKVMALRFENNLPPFVLMTHKKMPKKKNKVDYDILNEGAKKMYLEFYKKIMKKIAPDRVNKFNRE